MRNDEGWIWFCTEGNGPKWTRVRKRKEVGEVGGTWWVLIGGIGFIEKREESKIGSSLGLSVELSKATMSKDVRTLTPPTTLLMPSSLLIPPLS